MARRNGVEEKPSRPKDSTAVSVASTTGTIGLKPATTSLSGGSIANNQAHIDIAQEAGLGLVEMRDLYPSKGAILDGFIRVIDKRVIAGTTEDLAGEPARERIFDVVMRRLDAMAPYKRALRRIEDALAKASA